MSFCMDCKIASLVAYKTREMSILLAVRTRVVRAPCGKAGLRRSYFRRQRGSASAPPVSPAKWRPGKGEGCRQHAVDGRMGEGGTRGVRALEQEFGE